MNKRESGFYWVKYLDNETVQVGYWSGEVGRWQLTGSRSDYGDTEMEVLSDMLEAPEDVAQGGGAAGAATLPAGVQKPPAPLSGVAYGPTDVMADLWQLCRKFITDNRITAVESIYQMDHVAENALNFIEDIVELIGLAPIEEN